MARDTPTGGATTFSGQTNDELKLVAHRVGYTANPYLTEPDLTTWEAANGVVLPEAYRLFLLEIGNGGFMPGGYCDFEMFPLNPRRVNARLREPFPLSRDRFEQQIARPRTKGEKDELPFPELNEGIDDSEDWKEPGCLQLGHYPSHDPVYLIVSGDLRGTVWCFVEGWIPELDRQRKPFDFLGWFEDALVDLSGLKGR